MEMPIPYRIYTKIPKEEIVRTVEARCTGDIRYTVQIQGSRNYRRCSVCQSCAYVRKYPAEDKYFKFYGIPEGEQSEEARKEESEGAAF